jgi:flavin reductase (DIM6/NTAB) family NADH-FMN oxidoreductase RutF
MPSTEHPPLSRALGRIPSGLYVVTTVADGAPLGFLGSFVQQVGFEPPTLVVAVGRERPHLEAIRSFGWFALSVLDPASKGLMAPFFRSLPPGQSPFDDVATATTPEGLATLADALAWIECRVLGEHPAGDHVVVFGEAVRGQMTRDGEPLVHLRRNGFSY